MDKKNFDRNGFSIFASYIKPHKVAFITDMLLAVMIALIDLIFPYVSRYSMYHLLPDGIYKTFFIVMGIMFISYILRALFQYFETVIGHRMGTLVEADMRRDVFTHMQSLSYSFFDKNRTGVLMSRVTNDLFEIVELSHHGPENILTCSITIIGALVIMLKINWRLALVMLIFLPLSVFFAMHERRNMQKQNKIVKVRTGEINASIESGISGIRTSKAFANEGSEEDKFNKANENFKNSKVSYYKAMGRFNAGIEAAVGLMQVAVISVGGFLIMKNNLNYIDLITFTLYISTFTSPIRKMAQFMEIFTQGMAGFDRFLDLMRTKPSITDADDAMTLSKIKGEITFKDVSFSYNDGTEVLDDINVTIKPGETYALVGSSGGGKTTMCHHIPRFYDVSRGSVMIDGIDVRNITQKSLREHIGIIQQDVFLFAGTVLENIRYGRPDATDEEVYTAAKNADIHKEILDMPDGYNTYVGERGIVLSGGQKQRISIARVFLKNPPILILDEATSALDSVTEAKIQESLYKLSVGKTCIVIAHRLSTVRSADRIAVIDDKKIIEEGSREELINLNGVYASLEKAQAL